MIDRGVESHSCNMSAVEISASAGISEDGFQLMEGFLVQHLPTSICDLHNLQSELQKWFVVSQAMIGD